MGVAHNREPQSTAQGQYLAIMELPSSTTRLRTGLEPRGHLRAGPGYLSLFPGDNSGLRQAKPGFFIIVYVTFNPPLYGGLRLPDR